MSMHLERLRLHRLTYLDDGDEVVVGRADTDSYAVFPPDGAELLRRLESGDTPGAAAEWYRQTYDESVDMAEFVDTLEELQFIRDGAEPVSADRSGEPETVPWQRAGRILFSPCGWILFGLLVVAAVLVCLIDPRLAPRPQNVLFTDYLTVVTLTVVLGQLPLIGVHELFHTLAGRRLGLRSRTSLGRRLYFLVFETSLDGLVAVPRGKRFLPILAGLLADVLAMAALTVTAYLTQDPDAGSRSPGACASRWAFSTIPRITWQFYFFLRTDMYYLITTVLGCVDLQTTARELLRNRANRLLGRRDQLVDESRWHPRDRRAARWYAPLLVAGYATSVATSSSSSRR
jgi:hypothetical protein